MTVGEAYKAKLLTWERIDRAVSAYLADSSKLAVLEFGGKRLDVAAAVNANPWARVFVSDRGFTQEQQRMAVRTAILLELVG
ncbi:hypothetical protein [Methylobacterium nonmethylotrophicum]|uniref:Uncharacterized protein n=1 Tax=Methylobacterium nonmethylotrophicum TaxID=1141884 RepID=A0A4Z0NWA5_9HYPH|nr:hypothetical protein [Methylobacterium nonmethylotrophicum]TGE01420.1 hypothetical protein EU555_04755 [Methylobacterium nonmethylotrophicum]